MPCTVCNTAASVPAGLAEAAVAGLAAPEHVAVRVAGRAVGRAAGPDGYEGASHHRRVGIV